MNGTVRSVRFVAVACAASVAWGCASAPPSAVRDVGLTPIVPTTAAASHATSVNTAATSTFTVRFHGIIVHAKMPAPPPTWRAVLISGDFGRQHIPLLAVSTPSDPDEERTLKRALNAATNQIVRCDKNQCRVRVGGIAMRIRGNTDPVPAVAVDPSFDCLLPHLRRDPLIDGGEILPEIKKPASLQRAVLPSAPAVGYFEIEGGTLKAAPSIENGYFTEPYEACVKKTNNPAECEKKLCRQFPGVVHWTGTTDGPAMLEIASNWTAWKWVRIPIANKGRLIISVENQTSDHHADPSHFSLNEKVLTNKNLPEITVGCTLDPGKECPVAFAKALAVVPGCVDNQWP